MKNKLLHPSCARTIAQFYPTHRAVHFVGFRGDEYNRAQKIWGKPDFVHMVYDARAIAEIFFGDIVIFSRFNKQTKTTMFLTPWEHHIIEKFTRDDSAHF